MDLKALLDTQRGDAIARVTQLCRRAHQAHEAAGGYAMEFATHIATLDHHPDRAAANASINAHLKIQDRRRATIAEINQAPHGAAINHIVEDLRNVLGVV
jgi:hypothetical protein